MHGPPDPAIRATVIRGLGARAGSGVGPRNLRNREAFLCHSGVMPNQDGGCSGSKLLCSGAIADQERQGTRTQLQTIMAAVYQPVYQDILTSCHREILRGVYQTVYQGPPRFAYTFAEYAQNRVDTGDLWCGWGDSNARPRASEARALSS
jgi:hypothetical protein